MIDIHCEVENAHLPASTEMRRWAEYAYQNKHDAQVALTVVDSAQMEKLNTTYRGKETPTNVLSFPANTELPDGSTHLGDIVLCDSVISAEASEQNKSDTAHWAHMIVHGMLHLQNFDHATDDEADIMEALEIKLLAELGFDNPY